MNWMNHFDILVLYICTGDNNGILGVFRDNFPRFACWGDLILIQFQNQFCACSE